MTYHRRRQRFDTSGGYRSGYERLCSEQAPEGTTYESDKLEYPLKTNRKAVCNSCGGHDVSTLATYTPDLVLPNGALVEIKGRFVSADRSKHKAIAKLYPARPVHFIMKYDGWLTKKKLKRFSDWLASNGNPFYFTGQAIGWQEALKKVLKDWAR